MSQAKDELGEQDSKSDSSRDLSREEAILVALEETENIFGLFLNSINDLPEKVDTIKEEENLNSGSDVNLDECKSNSEIANENKEDELDFKIENWLNNTSEIQIINNNVIYVDEIGVARVENEKIKQDLNASPTTIEPTLLETVSSLERQVLSRVEMLPDNRKSKILQLPPDSIPITSSRCEKELVGDDVANTKAHIVCECDQPGVSGGAVPTVISFTLNDAPKNKKSDNAINKEQKEGVQKVEQKVSRPKASLIPKLTNSYRTNRLNAKPPKQPNYEEKFAEHDKNITSKMLAFQQKIRETSSLLKAKVSQSNAVENKKSPDQNDHQKLEENSPNHQKGNKMILNELYKNINLLNKEAVNLINIENENNKTFMIDNIENLISSLKGLIGQFKEGESNSEDRVNELQENLTANRDAESKSKAKENNKIHIKFLSSKSGAKKRKTNELQAEVVKEPGEPKLINEEERRKSQDSMDGFFLPSPDAPSPVEEDDDEDGLDITITFPEFRQNITHEADSHVTVCFSDISAEALGRLKRCPKDFTLHMDFAQRKMTFQTGNLPTNNFSIGADLKVTEIPVDTKKSDIISIKPSTECTYASQVIPVIEGPRRSSVKTLKSTDSELFDVVSLPFLNRKSSVTTRSCITFKNSAATHPSSCLLLDRLRYRSMPQIPSLPNIFEEPGLEGTSASKSGVI
ncbi:uncharacterized protein LOC115880100 isoform X2 [Sitophilus oryzae]|uniref:Uncharacterized protein LOC115880100 isoform X2 n=1 Tax=Sitophilus oryzae TaxID=7048 RepID=A0A6J2XNY9_SITOR|nr:uncharacterized protein LOC115880100 isoform X2 [Sitophilus oryzae]